MLLPDRNLPVLHFRIGRLLDAEGASYLTLSPATADSRQPDHLRVDVGGHSASGLASVGVMTLVRRPLAGAAGAVGAAGIVTTGPVASPPMSSSDTCQSLFLPSQQTTTNPRIP